MPVIDIHTHMLSEAWLDLLEEHGAPRYSVATVPGGDRAVHLDGAPFMTLQRGMFDYDLRIEAMDAAGVDIAVVSLTCPNTYFGGAAVSDRAAKVVNDDMAAAQDRHPERIRWLCSLPWQHADLAVAELDRACGLGAVGVMVLANVDGISLTDPAFAAVWEAIDDRALPVLVHPTAPPAVGELDMAAYNLVASVGFVMDTTLAIARMIFDGFIDRHPNLTLIAGHGGGTLPYVAGRLDQCHAQMPACRARIEAPPSEYLRRICFDTVVYRPEALALCVEVAGADNVLYGSDYPHNIGDMAGCLARVDALDPAVADAIRGGNAMKLFRL